MTSPEIIQGGPCSCSSCISLGYAKPRHIGDCDSCNADGETETVVHDECEFELCVKCHSNAPESIQNIHEARYERQEWGDRCVRGGYEP